MNLQQLITITDKFYYSEIDYFKVIKSKQDELLEIIKPSTNIKKIDYKLILKYYETLQKKGNKPATINTKMSYLSNILEYALDHRLIDYKPAIPYSKVTEVKEIYINDDIMDIILDWCIKNEQLELHDILKIAYYTGLRINNVLSLIDKNYKDNILYIHDKKTNSDFIVPVSEKILDIIETHKNFTMNYQAVYYLFNQMKKDIGLDNRVTIHTLRHSFCSNLSEKGVPLPVIAALANHKKLATTMKYSHTNKQQLIAAIAVL